jgi:AcrR family transcriptional regulator
MGERTTARRPRETERAFIAAATDLFAEKGYKATSISDLAKELGLTTASLYYHVSGKQELLFRVLETGMADFLDQLEGIATKNVDHREKLRLAVENHLDFVLTNQNAVKVFLRERRFLDAPYRDRYEVGVDRYDRLFSGIVQDAMDAHAVQREDPTLVRLAILGMINWVVEWYRPSGSLGKDEISATMTRLITDRLLGG